LSSKKEVRIEILRRGEKRVDEGNGDCDAASYATAPTSKLARFASGNKHVGKGAMRGVVWFGEVTTYFLMGRTSVWII
jgi:hypothetical protein